MAVILRLNSRIEGMDRILNVSQRVGPWPDCPNMRDDVEAVQRLFGIAGVQFSTRHGFPLPQPSGTYDPLTGFYIFYLQAKIRRSTPASIVDGVISPAHGTIYGGGVWTIVHMNFISYNQNRPAWETLMQRYGG